MATKEEAAFAMVDQLNKAMTTTFRVLGAVGSLIAMGLGVYYGFDGQWARGSWFVTVGYGGMILDTLREKK